MPSRNLDDLMNPFQSVVRNALEEFNEKHKGIMKAVVICTSRKLVEQIALFCKGRMTDLEDVARVYRKVGLPTPTDNRECTWTLESMHIDFRAIDFMIVEEGGDVNWNAKADIDKDKISDYQEFYYACREAAINLQLHPDFIVWGDSWKDSGHIEWRG